MGSRDFPVCRVSTGEGLTGVGGPYPVGPNAAAELPVGTGWSGRSKAQVAGGGHPGAPGAADAVLQRLLDRQQPDAIKTGVW